MEQIKVWVSPKKCYNLIKFQKPVFLHRDEQKRVNIYSPVKFRKVKNSELDLSVFEVSFSFAVLGGPFFKTGLELFKFIEKELVFKNPSILNRLKAWVS